MKLELDLWRELWDREGSRGLDNWHELPETAEEEAVPPPDPSGLVDGLEEGW